MPLVPESEVLPCGCRLDCDVIAGVNTLMITACRLGAHCANLANALAYANERAKPVTVLDAS